MNQSLKIMADLDIAMLAKIFRENVIILDIEFFELNEKVGLQG